jgi:hypothetical protein
MRLPFALSFALSMLVAPAARADDDPYVGLARAQDPPPREQERKPPPEPEMSEAPNGFGLIFTGMGGSAVGSAGLSTSTGVDEPDPLAGASLRTSGTRPVGGFTTDLLVRIDDMRLGIGTTLGFGDGFSLSSNPLPNQFEARLGSAIFVDFHAWFGRQIRLGPVMPYADVVIGGSFLQTNVRLHHPAFGFLGETRYDQLRFSLGPRLGVAVPIRGPLFIDGGGRLDIFGFVRLSGYIGLGLFVGGR